MQSKKCCLCNNKYCKKTKESKSDWKMRKYCSLICAWKGKDYKKNIARPKGVRLKISHTKRSQELYNELSPNWKGGKTLLQPKYKSWGIYKEWKKKVLELNNNLCSQCLKLYNDNTLFVFHTKNLYQILKWYNIDTPKEALKLENSIWSPKCGKVVCASCLRSNEINHDANINKKCYYCKSKMVVEFYKIKNGIIKKGLCPKCDNKIVDSWIRNGQQFECLCKFKISIDDYTKIVQSNDHYLLCSNLNCQLSKKI